MVKELVKGKDINKNFTLPVTFIALGITLWVGWIVFNAFKLVVVDGDFWRNQGLKGVVDSLQVKPNRGSIYACDGQLLASTLPVYQPFMDFGAKAFEDTSASNCLLRNLDSLCILMARVYRKSSAAEYKTRILSESVKKKNRHFVFEKNEWVSFTQSMEIRKFPFFRERKSNGTWRMEERKRRTKPFGSLASRTIGSLYENNDKGGICGLERQYNTELSGVPGLGHRDRVNGTMSIINYVDPIDGYDIVATIDPMAQDITETALKEAMREDNAERGCAVVMDVKTGEIRAISNLLNRGDGGFVEVENYAVNSMTEPGSTFKVASVIALLESGLADTSKVIDTKDGVWEEPGWNVSMRDHNYLRGGYGKISLAQAIWYSSNIGISKSVYEAFKDKPGLFVNMLYAMKMNDSLKLEIPGAAKPNIRHPNDKSKEKWSGTTLPWMSIGYEVQVPPINTLTFYNAIANDGKMIKPIFTKEVKRGDKVVRTNKTEVICQSICGKITLGKVRSMLKGVVEYGTGSKTAKSKLLSLAGKSGTSIMDYDVAQKRKKGYQVSFCGYFPADNPKYSCIVVLWQESANNPSGKAFRQIAEKVYALTSEPLASKAECDRRIPYAPMVKNGKSEGLKNVLGSLKIRNSGGEEKGGWIRAEVADSVVRLTDVRTGKSVMPSVMGMGARDAVCLLENKGLKVVMSGRGAVYQQSIRSGDAIAPGNTVQIFLK